MRIQTIPPSRITNGSIRGRDPYRTVQQQAALRNLRLERSMKQVDLLQLWTFWLGFVVSLAMYYSLTLTEPLLRGVLGAVTVIVLGSEAWLAWTTKRSFLRLRGFILGGLYIWLLLKPLVFGALHNNYYLKLTIKDLWLL